MSHLGSLADGSGQTQFTPIASQYGGVGQSSYNDGDLLYGNNGELTTLPSGEEGQGLVIEAGQLTWGQVATGGQADASGLQGRPISSAAPAGNDVLTWTGSQWEPAAPSGGGGGGSPTQGQRTIMFLSANATNNTGNQNILLDGIEFDSALAADTGNNRITIPAALDGKRVRVYGQVTQNSSPSWSANDVVGLQINHEDSVGAFISAWVNRDQATGGSNSQYHQMFTTSFVVASGDRIRLIGFTANFTASRTFFGSLTSKNRCFLEMEVLD